MRRRSVRAPLTHDRGDAAVLSRLAPISAYAFLAHGSMRLTIRTRTYRHRL